jgi:hypothetical protein
MDVGLQNMGDLALTQANTARVKALGAVASNTAIDKAAKDFESVFVTQMLQPMFEGIKVDDNFGGGHGEEIMKSFMLQEYGKKIADTGMLKVSTAVKNAMLQAQQVSQSGGKNVQG